MQMDDRAAAQKEWALLRFSATGFSTWFSGSKIVKDGEPRVVYRGDHAPIVSVEGLTRGRLLTHLDIGHWFTATEQAARADGEVVTAVYLCMRNPRRVTRKQLEKMAGQLSSEAMIQALRLGGFDGVIISASAPDLDAFDPGSPELYVVFGSHQAKAVDNCGLFDPRSTSLRDGGAAEHTAALPAAPSAAPVVAAVSEQDAELIRLYEAARQIVLPPDPATSAAEGSKPRQLKDNLALGPGFAAWEPA